MAEQAPTPKVPSLRGAPWLARPQTQAVFAALADAGFAARAVGGAVRNALMRRPVGDVDIATPATPDEVMAAARSAGLSAVPTGVVHGTVTVIAEGMPHEVTTLRRDVATDGRRATVAFTDDWEADARRRDFTINALYCAGDGQVFDPLGGYADILARRVRFVGDAAERIREDYLRILRFFRFTAEYAAGPLDAAGLAACVAGRAGLAQLSAERVRQEFMRLLVAPRAVEVVRALQDYGVLAWVLPAAPRPGGLARLAAIEAALGRAPDPVLRFGALAVEIADDIDRLRDRLRLSNDTAARLAAAVFVLPPAIDPVLGELAARAALYRLGPTAYRESVLLAWARSGAGPASAAWRSLSDLPERWSAPRFPLGGADVMAEGVAAGPRVGAILADLEARWVADDFATSDSDLRTALRELAREG